MQHLVDFFPSNLVSSHGEVSHVLLLVRAQVDGVLWDMTRPLEGDCKLVIHKFDSDKGRDTFWHSSAHILGQVCLSTLPIYSDFEVCRKVLNMISFFCLCMIAVYRNDLRMQALYRSLHHQRRGTHFSPLSCPQFSFFQYIILFICYFASFNFWWALIRASNFEDLFWFWMQFLYYINHSFLSSIFFHRCRVSTTMRSIMGLRWPRKMISEKFKLKQPRQSRFVNVLKVCWTVIPIYQWTCSKTFQMMSKFLICTVFLSVKLGERVQHLLNLSVFVVFEFSVFDLVLSGIFPSRPVEMMTLVSVPHVHRISRRLRGLKWPVNKLWSSFQTTNLRYDSLYELCLEIIHQQEHSNHIRALYSFVMSWLCAWKITHQRYISEVF